MSEETSEAAHFRVRKKKTWEIGFNWFPEFSSYTLDEFVGVEQMPGDRFRAHAGAGVWFGGVAVWSHSDPHKSSSYNMITLEKYEALKISDGI